MLVGDINGGGRMANDINRTRVALALFDRGIDLAPALRGLEAAGFDGGQLGIAARASRFVSLKTDYAAGVLSARIAAPLICGSTLLGAGALDDPVRISTGTFWPALRCFGADSGSPLVSAPWMAPRLRDELSRHLTDGAILLGVGAVSPEQQRSATQLLLNHSSHRVHTHDFLH